ncbi:hypothetical protein [uncultured Roseobacter sp.]|uniref:hypothetical protein n=1 Tax=uncultured Roseobacter sp. TaxID=114847 RepID=UPI0026186D3F|nr:hypothetical protein [uncultured Roseobacter sp.]
MIGTAPIIGPPASSEDALRRMNRFTPVRMAISMNGTIVCNGSATPLGATR